ncbi:MAG: glycosyltransferase family 39 protein [Myxococcales bacterium]
MQLKTNLPPRKSFAAFALVLLGYAAYVGPFLPLPSVEWRESDVLMVGRNLCRGEASLWLPRIDARGDTSGITGMELPVLNQWGAAISCGGNGQVVATRVVTFAFALLSIASFAWLAFRHLSFGGAGLALAAFAFSPIILFYGRATQPDVPSMSLALTSLALLDLALPPEGTTRWAPWFASALAMALAALIKLPALVYGLPMVWLVWTRRGTRALADVRYWLFLPLALAPPAVWYLHARDLQQTYGLTYFYLGASWSSLLADWTSTRFYQRLFLRQLFDVYAFPLISAMALIAFAFLRRRMPGWIGFAALGVLVFLFLGGWGAAWHNCYGVMATPPLALAAAVAAESALARIPGSRPRVAALGLLLAATCGYGVNRTYHWFTEPDEEQHFAKARDLVDRSVDRTARAVVFSDADPKSLWYLDRKGWAVAAQNASTWLPDRTRGPLVAVIDKTRFAASSPQLKGVREALERAGFRERLDDAVVAVWLDAAP